MDSGVMEVCLSRRNLYTDQKEVREQAPRLSGESMLRDK